MNSEIVRGTKPKDLMHSNEVEVLSENENGRIFRCKCCNDFNLQYKNIYLLFTWKQLGNFHKTVIGITGREFYYNSPQGEQAILRNDAMRMGIAFTKAEIAEIDALYQEAALIESAITLVKSNIEP